MTDHRMLVRVAAVAALLTVAAGTAATHGARPGGQFDNVAIPPEMAHLEFLVGTWTVENTYRTPDHIGADRTLWYLTGNGGVSRFDGRAWHSWLPGESTEADAIIDRIREAPAEPAVYTYTRRVDRVQDGFALVVDDGRTGGTALVAWDVEGARFLWRALHAPTGSFSESPGTVEGTTLTFTGSGDGPRGTQVSRTRYDVVDSDHYVVHVDVSFDDGTTWIVDQSVQTVRRQS